MLQYWHYSRHNDPEQGAVAANLRVTRLANAELQREVEQARAQLLNGNMPAVAIVLEGVRALIWVIAARQLGLRHLLIDPSLPGAQWGRALSDFCPDRVIAASPTQIHRSGVREYSAPENWARIAWCWCGVENTAPTPSVYSGVAGSFEAAAGSFPAAAGSFPAAAGASPAAAGASPAAAGASPAAAGASPAAAGASATWFCGDASGAWRRLPARPVARALPPNAAVAAQAAQESWLFVNGLWHWPSLNKLLALFEEVAGGSVHPELVILDTALASIALPALRDNLITHILCATWALAEVAPALSAWADSLQDQGATKVPSPLLELTGDHDCPAVLQPHSSLSGISLLRTYQVDPTVPAVCLPAHSEAILLDLATGEFLDQAYETGMIYLQLPAENQQRSQAAGSDQLSGHYPTGDLGYRDQSGELRIRGSAARQIRRRGAVIQPEELERVILSRPEVSQAWVGLMRAQLGKHTRLCAVVSLLKGNAGNPLLAVELLDQCRALLAAGSYLDNLYFVEVMPRFRSGEIDTAAINRAISPATDLQGNIDLSEPGR